MSGSAIVIGVGAVAGLGSALCRRFASEGLQVFAAGRTEEKLELVAGEIVRRGGSAIPVSWSPARSCAGGEAPFRSSWTPRWRTR
jgi:NADP-dependent 3-hydroxy acid dehydrogenase YdfG